MVLQTQLLKPPHIETGTKELKENNKGGRFGHQRSEGTHLHGGGQLGRNNGLPPPEKKKSSKEAEKRTEGKTCRAHGLQRKKTYLNITTRASQGRGAHRVQRISSSKKRRRDDKTTKDNMGHLNRANPVGRNSY